MAKGTNIKFTEEIKTGRFRFTAGSVVEFEDPAVAEYLDKAFNGAEPTTTKANYVVGKDELRLAGTKEDHTPDHLIDPLTILGEGRDGHPAGIRVHDVETKSA